MYNQYDLIYDKGTDRLYYNEELVRYFEDIESENYYKKWTFKDGSIDVYAVRIASGGLIGVEPFSQQAFNERTPLLEGEIYALQITDSKSNSDDYSSENIYYTKEMEQEKKETLKQLYAIYQQYGLTYDMESDKLYYSGNLVDYFEDKELYRYFGQYTDGGINVYAIRDNKGKLTGIAEKNIHHIPRKNMQL